MHRILIVLLALLLGACATGPRYPTTGVDVGLQATEVATRPGSFSGTRVIWGGVIVATRNLDRHTEIEVLAYPLDNRQRPRTDRAPQGRFLLQETGYLEAVSHAPGRLITVTGTLVDKVQGRVGEAPYTYPLLEAQALHLWPLETGRESSDTRFHIGVGVIFGR